MKTINKFLAQAIDCYPGNLEASIEALDYALSYDEKSTMTLCLYGRLMSEQLLRFEEAKTFFERALAIDINAVEIYPHYIRALANNEDFEQAKKLAAFAITVKGINKYQLAEAKIELFEKMHAFDEAESAIAEAKLWHVCSWDLNDLEASEKRIKMKRDLVSGVSKPAKTKKSKKKAA